MQIAESYNAYLFMGGPVGFSYDYEISQAYRTSETPHTKIPRLLLGK